MQNNIFKHKTRSYEKILISAILLLAVFSASAQFRVDLRIGATASSFGDQHLKIGIRAGAGVEYLFSERWGLRSGLFFSMKGATTSNNVFNYDSDKATRLSYVDLPVEAVVSFRLAQRSRLALHGGPYVACLLHSSLPDGVEDNVRRLDAGCGLGADFIVGHFVIGPEVQYGLTRLIKFGSSHNTTYALTLGYRF